VEFIERYLGFSPDLGDGSVELLLVAALLAIIVGLALRLPKAS
jgi:hypothetical protein